MPKLVVRCVALSLDGYMCAPGQSLEHPFGPGGTAVMDWVFPTKTFHAMTGQEGGVTGIDDDFVARSFDGIGANIMGRNMFGPLRGPWANEDWKGWWGPNPPYHSPTFVVTHHARGAVAMEGGTTFHFVTEGIESALKQAFAAAGGKDVRLNGGATLIRQFLRAGLVDEMHLVLTSALLGGGERLFEGTEEAVKTLERVEFVASGSVAHVRLAKKK